MMHSKLHINQFYRQTKRGHVLRALALDDVSFWGADRLISVIFALFIVSNITGGSATHVGIALMIRQLVIAFLSVPVGRLLDKHKGYIDEVYFLALSGILAGVAYIFLGFSTQLWQVYILMACIGVAHTFNLDTWRVLFYGLIKKGEQGETTGIYQTIMSVTGALILVIGGIVADKYGYSTIMWIGAVMTIIAGIIPLSIKHLVPKK